MFPLGNSNLDNPKPKLIKILNHFIATVRGVDLFPPPVNWMPPNCILEVDDVLREWTWREPFDFIHLRIMLGAFTAKEWDSIYKKCYEYVMPRIPNCQFASGRSLLVVNSYSQIQESQTRRLDRATRTRRSSRIRRRKYTTQQYGRKLG